MDGIVAVKAVDHRSPVQSVSRPALELLLLLSLPRTPHRTPGSLPCSGCILHLDVLVSHLPSYSGIRVPSQDSMHPVVFETGVRYGRLKHRKVDNVEEEEDNCR